MHLELEIMNTTFEVENICRVRHATIELNGVTVLAGENATGKSTVARALRVLHSIDEHLGELVQYERLSSVFEAALASARRHNIEWGIAEESVPAPYRLGPWGEWLDTGFWDGEDRFRQWMETWFGTIRREAHPPPPERKPMGWLAWRALAPAAFHAWQADIRGKLLEIFGRPIDEYVQHVCTKMLNTVYADWHQWYGVLPNGKDFMVRENRLEKGISSISRTTNVFERKHTKGSDESSILYLEPLHLIDFIKDEVRTDRFGAFDRYMADESAPLELLRKRTPDNPTLETQAGLDDAKAVLDRIVGLIHGRLQDRQDEIVFEERDGKRSTDIKISNMASGMKTMSAVVRALENGTLGRGGLLIIDEPESNLHPEWQVSFAQFLVLLHRELDVRILLATHSPYFLKAIQVYGDYAEVGEKCRYYRMEEDSERGGFVSRDCTKNVREIFESLMMPYAKLKYGDTHEMGNA